MLALFDRAQPEWSLNGLVERTGLHKSTAYRMVRTLEEERFLDLDRDTGNYHLGPAMYRVAFLANAHSELVRLAPG
jgi:DNA-binding IclR family transcriptional regulator